METVIEFLAISFIIVSAICLCAGIITGAKKEEKYSIINRMNPFSNKHHNIYYIGRKKHKCSICGKKYKDRSQAIYCC